MCKNGPGPLGPRCKKVEEDVHEIGNNIKEDGMIGARKNSKPEHIINRP